MLNPSEAVFGFAGWLTCRQEILTIGATETCGKIAKLAEEFCSANKLEKPRNGWENDLIHPPENLMTAERKKWLKQNWNNYRGWIPPRWSRGRRQRDIYKLAEAIINKVPELADLKAEMEKIP